MFDKIIIYSFYALFFLTPIFWTSLNYELFEYNKMILTYGITTIIVGAWILKMVQEKTLILKRTPLDIPLLLFLGANILSTIFSIDQHTSIWGYYSRSNGGLLSVISYFLLYFAFVSNFSSSRIKTLLKVGLTSGLVISLWGIFEHFGVSPSCVILRGEFNATCWVQDVQARVFATLGQPNWMAGYLSMLIFPALYFLLEAKTRKLQVISYLLLVTFYLAFTFTYSRGPTLGLIGGMIMFLIYYLFLPYFHRISTILPLKKFITTKLLQAPLIETIRNSVEIHRIVIVLVSFLTINLLFGSALTNFRLVSKFAAPARPTIALPSSSVTQLESGGTESGQIRLVVWKGALDIFRHYPILGSGVETFAQIYYQFRPPEHNLTSEWDFLYNKAHNEYLNYLATTGIVGFGTYMLVIGTFVFWCIKRFMIYDLRDKNQNLKSYILILISLLASYISFLIYNFFLFSVVILAIFFYLFPAIAFVATESTKVISYKLSVISWLYKKPLYTKIAQALVIFSTLYLLYSIFQLWRADTLFNKGQDASNSGSPGKAYNYLIQASSLNTSEPFYQSELAYSAAASAAALKDTDATLSGELKDQAVFEINKVLKENPKNVSYLRTAVRTYFELASLDKIYLQKTLEVLNKAISLAPTDPKLYYNKALILQTLGKKDEEIKILEKTIRLKPNYQEALDQLKQATASGKP